MKKIIALFLIAATALYLFSCNGTDEDKFSCYYGVVTELEGWTEPCVYIPDLGMCEIPSFEEGREEELNLLGGDLIAITFRGDDIAVMESYPARFGARAYSITVHRQGIEFIREGDGYFLTQDLTEELRLALGEHGKGEGDVLYLIEYGGEINESGQGVGYQRLYCTATVESIVDGRITLALDIPAGSGGSFLSVYASSLIISPVRES